MLSRISLAKAELSPLLLANLTSTLTPVIVASEGIANPNLSKIIWLELSPLPDVVAHVFTELPAAF